MDRNQRFGNEIEPLLFSYFYLSITERRDESELITLEDIHHQK